MNTYYNPDDLAKFPTIGEEAPELWDAFLKYYGPVMAEGALTAREKALIALAVAHSEMCPYCIDSYTQTLLEMGVDEEEMTEAVHVAAAMKAEQKYTFLKDMIFTHPTMSEALNDLFGSVK